VPDTMRVVDMPKGRATQVPAEGWGWAPYQDTPRPADLARGRFELFPEPGGVIAIFCDDYDAAGRVFRWLVGQALLAKAAAEPQGKLDV
jgi:hypothetical protein